MAQVPISGNVNMFGGSTEVFATSIYEVVKYHVGTPTGTDFDAIVTLVQAGTNGVTINDFHPNFRPSSLASIDRASQFRGFPVGSYLGNKIVWHMKEKQGIGV